MSANLDPMMPSTRLSVFLLLVFTLSIFAGLMIAAVAVMVIAVWGPATLTGYGDNNRSKKPLKL